MPEQLLTILKICLLVLLYLFLLRVVRAVWAEVQEPATATPDGPGPRATAEAPRAPRSGRRRRGLHELVVVEPPDRAGRAHPLAAEMTIGRAPGCTIVVEDQFVSSLHTRVFQSDAAWMVEDLGSTNGTYLNRTKVTGPTVLHRNDRLQVGNVVLEAR